MKVPSDIQCDLLVIGAGLAGMVAAARASALGMKTVQAGTSSGLFLTSGLFDLLGVYPAESGNILENPYLGIEKLAGQIPEHPYAKVSRQTIEDSVEFVTRFLSSAGLEYHSTNSKNLNVLTSAGTFKPTYLVPKTMLKGCQLLSKKKKVLLVDFKGLKGFSAQQIARTLETKEINASWLTIDVPQLSGDFNVTRLAQLFEESSFVEYVVKKILPHINDIELIGFPGVCGIDKSLEVMQSIEQQTKRDCFEIPGLPPSIPGLRLKNAFEKQISQNQAMVLNNAKVQFHAFEKKEAILSAHHEGRNVRIKTRGIILATGRFPGGGLHAKRGLIQETVFHSPIYQPRQRKLWYELDLFSSKGHSINQAGVLTDADFKLVDDKNNQAFDTLYAVGSILAYNDWVRLKSGAGVSCVSAFSAVNHFYDRYLSC